MGWRALSSGRGLRVDCDLHLVGLTGDGVGETGAVVTAVAEHVGELVLDARERELDGIADGQLVDAHHRVRAGRGLDVVVVRFVLEAVEAQVLETVGRYRTRGAWRRSRRS